MYVGRYGYMCVFVSMWVGGDSMGGVAITISGGGGDHQTLGHIYIYIYIYLCIYLLQEFPIRILSLPCQPRVQFKQHPSSTWTTFWQLLLHNIPAPACCSDYFFLHRHFFQPLFWICRIQHLPQGCGGSLAQSLLHLIL